MSRKGKYNRYLFVKKYNRRSLILIRGRNKYISFDKDLDILKYVKFKFEYKYSNVSYLDRYNIDYIVIDNLDVIVDKKFDDNNYMKYLKIMYLKKILDEIKSNSIVVLNS